MPRVPVPDLRARVGRPGAGLTYFGFGVFVVRATRSAVFQSSFGIAFKANSVTTGIPSVVVYAEARSAPVTSI